MTGHHTGRIVTQWWYCKQSKDWRGQTYPQPLLLRSEISLFWRTSCVRDFLLFPSPFLLFFPWHNLPPQYACHPRQLPTWLRGSASPGDNSCTSIDPEKNVVDGNLSATFHVISSLYLLIGSYIFCISWHQHCTECVKIADNSVNGQNINSTAGNTIS